MPKKSPHTQELYDYPTISVERSNLKQGALSREALPSAIQSYTSREYGGSLNHISRRNLPPPATLNILGSQEVIVLMETIWSILRTRDITNPSDALLEDLAYEFQEAVYSLGDANASS